MLNRLVSLVFFFIMLFARQAMAQEPVKENRVEKFCLGQCSDGTSLIHGLGNGIYFRRPLLLEPPDVQLPSPPYGPKVWSPWAVCLSLGISPNGSLVCRQWSYGEYGFQIRPPYGFDLNRIGRPSRPENIYISTGGCFGPGPKPCTNCQPGDFACLSGCGIHGRITLY